MKTLFVSFVVLSLAFFFGCQNSITDPEILDTQNSVSTPVDENLAYKDFISTYPGVINLHGILLDPSHMFNSVAEINGVVRYKIENSGMHQSSVQYKILKNVSLYIDAKLKGGCPNHPGLWKVNSFTSEVIKTKASDTPTYLFVKSFRVCNTCCAPLNLVIKFQVDGNNLKVLSMNLQIVNRWVKVGQPEM